jgi:hypothetical protein
MAQGLLYCGLSTALHCSRILVDGFSIGEETRRHQEGLVVDSSGGDPSRDCVLSLRGCGVAMGGVVERMVGFGWR